MQARALPARHGVLWLLAGFQLFRRNPPLLTALTFGYLFFVLFLNMLPLIGPLLLPLALPTLTVIVGNGVRALEMGQPLGSIPLLQGVRANQVNLVRLGGLQLVGSLLILSISSLVEGGPQNLSGIEGADPAEMIGMIGRLLLISAPVLMAFWFAPLLTAWDGVPATKSVFFSLIASLRNWRAFTAYGLGAAMAGVALPGLLLIAAGSISPTLLNVLSVALRMLLVFVMAPVLMASVYLSYRDVFHGAPAEAPAPAPEETTDIPPDA